MVEGGIGGRLDESSWRWARVAVALLLLGVPLVVLLERHYHGEGAAELDEEQQTPPGVPDHGAEVTGEPEQIAQGEEAAHSPSETSEPRRYNSLEEVGSFFDAETGEPLVLYAGDPEGELRLFSSGAFDPATGEALKPLTEDVLEQHRAYLEARARAAQERQAREAARAADVAARQRREADQDRNLQPSLLAIQPGGLVVGFSDPSFETRLRNHLREEGIPLAPPLFKPAFYESGGAYDAVARGDRQVARELGLNKITVPIVIGGVRYEQRPAQSRPGLQSVSGVVSGAVLYTDGRVEPFEVRLAAAAFSAGPARENARGRLVRALFADGTFQRALKEVTP